MPPNLRGRPSKKLGLKRAGPFKVLERVSDTGFRLEMTGYGSRICKVFHARSLTPYEPDLELEIRAAQKHGVEFAIQPRIRRICDMSPE